MPLTRTYAHLEPVPSKRRNNEQPLSAGGSPLYLKKVELYEVACDELLAACEGGCTPDIVARLDATKNICLAGVDARVTKRLPIIGSGPAPRRLRQAADALEARAS